MKFYSLQSQESDSIIPLLRVSPTVVETSDPDYNEVVYSVSDDFFDQPFLFGNKESVTAILKDPCLNIENSSYNNPCFDDVEDWIENLVPVEIEISDHPLNDDSIEIYLYEINEYHELFSKQSPCHCYKKGGNKLIQYRDELPPSDAEDWDDAVREFFLSDMLDYFPIIIEHPDVNVYGKKSDFSEDTFNKVKKYLTITKL